MLMSLIIGGDILGGYVDFSRHPHIHLRWWPSVCFILSRRLFRNLPCDDFSLTEPVDSPLENKLGVAFQSSIQVLMIVGVSLWLELISAVACF